MTLIGEWINRKLHERDILLSRGDYSKSLAECFEMANSEVYTRSQMMLKNRAYEFFKDGDKISRLSDYLRDNAGLYKYQYVGCGDNAIVVRYSENQALRFRAPEVEGRANTQTVLAAPFISPVWKEVRFFGGRLNFVPFHRSLGREIISGNVSRDTGEKCIHALMRAAFQHDPPIWFYDYYNYDFKFEQIALLDDSTPIIIDQGGVIWESDAPAEYSERIASERENALSRNLRFDLPWDGKWVDEVGKSKIDQLEKPPASILELTSG